jgi:hypothetical protein
MTHERDIQISMGVVQQGRTAHLFLWVWGLPGVHSFVLSLHQAQA